MREMKFSYKDSQKMAVPFKNGHMYKFMYGGSKRKQRRKVRGK